MKVPFLDLEAQYQSIKEEVSKKISEVIESKKFIQGDYADEFSRNFCEVHGVKYGVGCANGTSAITVALRAFGIGPGDEVITVANTFFATVEAIAEVGADIVLIDCLPDTYSMDVASIEKLITPKTKAIIPVHLYGNPVDMNELMKIANKHNLKVIEDCAQAHMASIDSKAVASFGDVGTFSFYPGKNLGAYGDAGFIATENEQLCQRLNMHINHGRTSKYEHEFLAGNYRIDGLQAAILNLKLSHIDQWTNKRIENAGYYNNRLETEGFKVIEVLPGNKCVYHLYIVEVSNREEVMKALKENGISTGIHYPVPMHLQPALKHLNYKKGDFPVSERSAERIISLPLYPELTEEQINYVVYEFLKVAKK